MTNIVHPWYKVTEDIKVSYQLTDEDQLTVAEALWVALLEGKVRQRSPTGVALKTHEVFEVPPSDHSPWVWDDEVNAWLKTCLPYVWHPRRVKEKKSSVQRQLILDELEAAGENPMCLTPYKNGLPSVKKEIKERLRGHYAFQALTSFNKTWQDLRNLGAIKVAKP